MAFATKYLAPLGGICCGAVLTLLTSGCDGTLLANQTAERTGNVSFTFINNTNFRASFSFGSFDSLDRSPPGPPTFQQLRLEAKTSSAAAAITCRRNAVVATQEFVQRVLDTNSDEGASFDADAFDSVVHFSGAPVDSDSAALPTAGTANGVNKLLGVDFSCADALIFTFEEDPDAPGGFRIDFASVQDTPPNQ